jgi:hypothetical protein
MRGFIVTTASLFLGAVSSALAAENCTRAFLKEASSRYIAAQSLGELRYMRSLSSTVNYTENAKVTDIKTGMISQPLKIDHSRSIFDTTVCASYTELIVTDPKHPYVIGTQIHFTGGNITKIESIVTDAEDWLFNAQHTLHYALPESWEPIPIESRDTRAAIRAAGDAYLDVFFNKSVVVPWGTPCTRLEGGLYTAPGDDCSSGVPDGIKLVNRRYVIDEVMGTVDVFLTFGESGLPDSHEFRVEGGKLRYVHTITACSTPNCGFDPPAQLKEELGF